MVIERKADKQRMDRDKEEIEDLERRLAGSEKHIETANDAVKEMEQGREVDQKEREKLKGRIKSLEGQLYKSEERFMQEWHGIQRAKFRAGREAFIARGAVEEQKESKEPPEETSREVVEVDYNDTTDEGQAEGEFFFSSPSTPGTEGEGEATETAEDPEPGLQSSSSSSTVWDGNQWKDPEEGNPTPEGEKPTSEPDQEVTQEATREENPKGPEEEKELVGREHRARRASRVPEASPMAKAQPKKSRKQPAGKGKGRNSGAK